MAEERTPRQRRKVSLSFETAAPVGDIMSALDLLDDAVNVDIHVTTVEEEVVRPTRSTKPRAWHDDPRAVRKKVAGKWRLDIDATLQKLGMTMAQIQERQWSQGTLEHAVKKAWGVRHGNDDPHAAYQET